jgi:hypothetical protein
MSPKEMDGLHEVRMERRRPPHPWSPGALLAASTRSRCTAGGARLAVTGALLESRDLARLMQTLLMVGVGIALRRRHVKP